MQTFRRVVLPVLYLVVLAVIAASLAWLAFAPAGGTDDDGESPTGEIVGSETVVTRGTIEASFEAEGTISIAEPVAAKATADGKVNHIWVKPGMVVSEGDELFQVEAEEFPDAGPEDDPSDDEASEPEPAPEVAPRRTYHTVTAPEGGTVGSFEVQVGDDVAKGSEVMSITPRVYSAAADIDPVDLYRLHDLPSKAEITIDRGPAPFDCTSLTLFEAGAPPTGGGGGSGGDEGLGDDAEVDLDEGGDAGAGGGEGSGTTQLRCTIPDDVEVYNGLSMRMNVSTGGAEDVLIVPVTAVRGMGEEATVWVPGETGEPEERDVEIGVTDGASAEVVSGLEEGEAILEYVPGTEPDAMDDEFGYIE